MTAKIFQLSTCIMLICAISSCRKKRCPPRVTINGYSWSVEVATTREERAKGFLGRKSLSDSEGMLFVYPRPQILKFWMQGCLIPLDVAFISSDKRVVKIHTMAVEPDLAGWNLYGSQVPAQYALEVSAGMFQRVGVRVGDAVTFSGDIPEAAKAEDGP